MAKLEDALDSKSSIFGCAGSNPVMGTKGFNEMTHLSSISLAVAIGSVVYYVAALAHVLPAHLQPSLADAYFWNILGWTLISVYLIHEVAGRIKAYLEERKND